MESGSLRGIPAEFVSISRCPFLLRVEDGAVEASDTLRALTVNENPKLSYISPNLAMRVDRLAALDLSKNALYALVSLLTMGIIQCVKVQIQIL